MDSKEKRIKNIIIQIAEIEAKEIDDNTTFIEDLKFDSIKIINLILELEEEFHFEFNNMVLLVSHFNNVHEFIEYVIECMEEYD